MQGSNCRSCAGRSSEQAVPAAPQILLQASPRKPRKSPRGAPKTGALGKGRLNLLLQWPLRHGALPCTRGGEPKIARGDPRPPPAFLGADLGFWVRLGVV